MLRGRRYNYSLYIFKIPETLQNQCLLGLRLRDCSKRYTVEILKVGGKRQIAVRLKEELWKQRTVFLGMRNYLVGLKLERTKQQMVL